MNKYKPITGELRGACELAAPKIEIDGTVRFSKVDFNYKQFIDLCDAIDAVHAELERENARLKAERDSMAAALDAAQGEHAYAPESHYMMLPKDADGVPIHVGDVMEWVRYEDDDKTIVRKVSAVGAGVFFAWSDEQGRYAQYEAHAYRHHVPDTWERIIMDAVCGGDEDELVARCKALAGES